MACPWVSRTNGRIRLALRISGIGVYLRIPPSMSGSGLAHRKQVSCGFVNVGKSSRIGLRNRRLGVRIPPGVILSLPRRPALLFAVSRDDDADVVAAAAGQRRGDQRVA